VSSEQALALLRGTAFLQDRWLSDLAGDVVTGQRPANLDDPPIASTTAS